MNGIQRPDWAVWKHVSKLTPPEAAALSLNLCPDMIRNILNEVTGSGSAALFELTAMGQGVSSADAKEFQNRLLILDRNFREYLDAAELPALAHRFGWSIPIELTESKSKIGATPPPTAALSESERTKLLKQIGGLSLLLAEKWTLYRRNGNPNADQIAKGVADAIEGLPNHKGTGNSSLRASIKEGIDLLKK